MSNHTKKQISKTSKTSKEYEYQCVTCSKTWTDQHNYDVTSCPHCETKAITMPAPKEKHE